MSWQPSWHDDVIKWKHFPRNWPFVREIHRSPVNFPHKGQWRGALMFSLIYAWINDWVNNREAGDLRRQHGHYDVIVMVRKCPDDLTHCGLLPPYGVGTHDWFRFMVCRLYGAKPYSVPILTYCQMNAQKKIQWNFNQNTYVFCQKMDLKMSSAEWRPFCPGHDVLSPNWPVFSICPNLPS